MWDYPDESRTHSIPLGRLTGETSSNGFSNKHLRLPARPMGPIWCPLNRQALKATAFRLSNRCWPYNPKSSRNSPKPKSMY